MYNCDVCGEPAIQACEECYTSFYCSDLCQAEHECDHNSEHELCHACYEETATVSCLCGETQYCGAAVCQQEASHECVADICDVCDNTTAPGSDFCGAECEQYALERPTHTDWTHCDACGADGATLICSGCHNGVYCDEECQEIDWNYHYTHECYAIEDMSDEHVMEHMDPDFVGTPMEARLELIEAVFRTKGKKIRRPRRKNFNTKKGKAARRKLKRVQKRNLKKGIRKGNKKTRKFQRDKRKADSAEKNAPKKAERKAKRKELWEKGKGFVKKTWQKGKAKIAAKKAKKRAEKDAGGGGTGLSGGKSKGKGGLKGALKGGLAGGAAGGILSGGNPGAAAAGAAGGAALGAIHERRKRAKGKA